MFDIVASSLAEYKNTLWDEIALNVSTNHSVDKEEFLQYVADQLVEAEEIEDFSYTPYEGVGKRNKKLQIDGYSYSEIEDSLSLFIAPSLSYTDDSLTASEANRLFALAISFLDNAEFVKENAEESSPGYGLACDLLGIYNSVQKYKIYLICDRERSSNISQVENTVARGKLVEKHIWDISRIFALANSSKGREDVVIDFEKFGIKGLPCMLASETDSYKAYLCNIPGLVLANMYNTYGGRLLEGNVRSFLQVRGKVNKGIRATILNEPDKFFAYNNGIAATASGIETSTIDGIQYITQISSLQIVNGGQTTASLAMALVKDKKDNSEENIKKISIPMKLSLVDPENADVLIANIARYANSQNKVSEADLWSNHPFHIRMEDFSRRIIAPATNGRQYGTYWYYERANGQYNQETYKATAKEKNRFLEQHPKSQRITKTDFAKYMHVYEQRPDIASLGGQKSFVKFAEKVSKEWEKDDTIYNEDYYKDSIAVSLLFREADSIVRKQPWYRSYKANIVAYTLSIIFYTVEKDYPNLAINLKAIWQKQALSVAWIRQIEKTSFVMYQHLIDENRDIENVTEWAKREKCWRMAQTLEIELLPEFIDELRDKAIDLSEKKYAKKDQRITNQLNSMIEVVNYGTNGWNSLLEWNKSHRVLSPAEIHLVDMAKKMDGALISSEKQCSKVLKVLDNCRLEGFNG